MAVSLALLSAGPARLADAQADQETELRRKTEEVERLKQELLRAQDQLKKLKEDNERLRQEQAKPPAAAAPVAPKPVTPLDTLPPLQADGLVDAHELAGHYKANPAAAGQRYEKKALRVRGQVARFATRLFFREYEVVLESPGSAGPVVCKFNYIDKFATVYTKQAGQLLVGRSTAGAERKLFQLGETAVVRGKCAGLKDGLVTLTGCEAAK